MFVRKLIIGSVLLGAAIGSNASADEILPAGADGWHTWQIDEPGVATKMCCYTWKRGDKSQKGCDLDGRNMSFSSDGDCAAAPGTVQIYVHVENGVPENIRVFSSNCQVSAASAIADHGLVSVVENVAWFKSIIENKSLDMDAREEALFGLVQSESDAAYAYIDGLLSSR
ncbi:MAG: hypothetical protein HQ492_12085 [Woeseiaceae bacterium]|nr:hypothetical protein [Woeseiaceae bacterium]